MITIPTLNIKSSDNVEQLKYVQSLNPHIELQLLESFLSDNWTNDALMEYIRQEAPDIQIIHTPLYQKRDVDLADIEIHETYHIIFKTFQLAQDIATITQKRIQVILHYGGNFSKLQQNETRCLVMIRRLERLLTAFREVDLLIENVIPLTQTGMTREGGFLLDVPHLVQWLKRELDMPNRISSVLDTCHAISTERLLKRCDLPSLSLTQYFESFSDTLGLIHLANVRELGFGLNEHGIGFETSTDLNLLNDILKLYQDFSCCCPITLEVHEQDYLSRVVYLKTETQVLEVFKKMIHDIR